MYIFSQKELNLRKKKWMDLIKDYDYTIHYHLGKVNVVANALSRKSSSSLACSTMGTTWLGKLKKINMEVQMNELRVTFTHLKV